MLVPSPCCNHWLGLVLITLKIRFTSICGWRKNEIAILVWDDISFSSQIIRLNAENNKTVTLKCWPLWGNSCHLTASFRGTGRGCPYVFNRKGQLIIDFSKALKKAIAQAGCSGRVFHALRRSSIRDSIRAGVHERVAMARSVHKTRSIFDRYNVSSERYVEDALRKSHAYRVLQTLSHSAENNHDEKPISISQ